MWETLLDALDRRYRRREGVSDEDLARVRESSGEPAIRTRVRRRTRNIDDGVDATPSLT